MDRNSCQEKNPVKVINANHCKSGMYDINNRRSAEDPAVRELNSWSRFEKKSLINAVIFSVLTGDVVNVFIAPP